MRDWWRLYEPDKAWTDAESRYAMLYLRVWINGNAGGTIRRSEIEARDRAIIRVGGHELYGIAIRLLKLAGDRSRGRRGYLIDHRDEPAGEAEIAETLGLDVETIRWALRKLTGPEIVLFERVWCAALPDDDRNPEEPADDADDHPDDDQKTLPPPNAAETPPAMEPDADGAPEPLPPPTAAPGGAADVGDGAGGGGEQRAEKRGTIPGYGLEKEQDVLPDSGETEMAAAQQEKRKGQGPVEPTGKDPRRGEGAWRRIFGGAGEVGSGSGRGEAAGSGPPTEMRPDGAGGDDALRPEPDAPDGSGGGPAATGERGDQVHGEPPTEMRPDGADGDGRRSPVPAHPDTATPNPKIWDRYKRGKRLVTWSMVRENLKGPEWFGWLIYWELGFEADGSVHKQNEEKGTFRVKWETALRYWREFKMSEAWLLELCETAIRKAASIADQRRDYQAGRREKDVDEPGAVFNAWFNKALQDATEEGLRRRR